MSLVLVRRHGDWVVTETIRAAGQRVITMPIDPGKPSAHDTSPNTFIDTTGRGPMAGKRAPTGGQIHARELFA